MSVAQETEMENSAISREMQDYIYMDHLFEEHTQESTSSDPSKTQGKAKVRTFTLTKTQDESIVDIDLYLQLPNGNTGKFSFSYDFRAPSSDIKAILNRSSDLSEIMLQTFTVTRDSKEGEVWEFKNITGDITETEQKPDHSIGKLNAMNTEFNRRLNKYEFVCQGEADIVDYYVRESAPNITQELEVGIKFKLPDGTTELFECIHDKDHPDEDLENLLDYLEIDSLFELPKNSVPVMYDSKQKQWTLQIPKTNENRLLELIERYIFSNKHTVPITKTYKHSGFTSPDTNSNKKMNQKLKKELSTEYEGTF